MKMTSTIGATLRNSPVPTVPFHLTTFASQYFHYQTLSNDLPLIIHQLQGICLVVSHRKASSSSHSGLKAGGSSAMSRSGSGNAVR